jgi:hypothetical protein
METQLFSFTLRGTKVVADDAQDGVAKGSPRFEHFLTIFFFLGGGVRGGLKNTPC